MNKDAQKSARTETGAAPAIVDLRNRVPKMSDDELVSLSVNALRLKDSGSVKQRNAASDLLPVIEGEIAERRAYKLANAPPKAPRVSKKKPRPALEEVQPEPQGEE